MGSAYKPAQVLVIRYQLIKLELEQGIQKKTGCNIKPISLAQLIQ